jgi:hypothetical protein
MIGVGVGTVTAGAGAAAGEAGRSCAMITSPDLMPTSDRARVVFTRSSVLGGNPASNFNRDSEIPASNEMDGIDETKIWILAMRFIEVGNMGQFYHLRIIKLYIIYRR